MEQNRTVHLPTDVIERRNKLRTTAERLWDTSHHEPTVQELSIALDWTPQEVLELQVVAQPMVRLHTPLTEDGRVLADMLADTQTLLPEEQHAEAELRHVLADCLDALTAREGVVYGPPGRVRGGLGIENQRHSWCSWLSGGGLPGPQGFEMPPKLLQITRTYHAEAGEDLLVVGTNPTTDKDRHV